ncbi:hypothetical protein [Rickettsiella grylli]|nr:hypothetical protein [Rickettsiella grylli]
MNPKDLKRSNDGLQADGSGSTITMTGGAIQVGRGDEISASNDGGSVMFQGGTMCTIDGIGVSCS